MQSLTSEPVANAQQSDEETDLPPPALKIRSFCEALESLEDIRNFLERISCFPEVIAANSLTDSVAQLYIQLVHVVCSLVSVTSLAMYSELYM